MTNRHIPLSLQGAKRRGKPPKMRTLQGIASLRSQL
jgi:hypothetical protein